MRKRRSHFAKRSQPRNVHEFRLQFLKASLRFLAFGQITNKSRKEARLARNHFADGKLHREG